MSTDRKTLRKNAIKYLIDLYWDDELNDLKESVQSEYEYLTLEQFSDQIKDHNIYYLICIGKCDIDETIKMIWTDMYNFSHDD